MPTPDAPQRPEPDPAPEAEPVVLHTLGHGTLPADAFAALVRDAGLQGIVDVRAHPGSRHNPQYGRREMERWLPAEGLSYAWIARLGGRRRPDADSPHVALRNTSFRAYADHMEGEEFRSGVEDLLAIDEPVAVLCSESVWWRCHRRLLADHLVLVRGVDVRHLMHDGRRTPHVPTEGVRVDGTRLVYDAAQPRLTD